MVCFLDVSLIRLQREHILTALVYVCVQNFATSISYSFLFFVFRCMLFTSQIMIVILAPNRQCVSPSLQMKVLLEQTNTSIEKS